MITFWTERLKENILLKLFLPASFYYFNVAAKTNHSCGSYYVSIGWHWVEQFFPARLCAL